MTKAVAAGPSLKTTVVRTTEEIPVDSSERAPEFWSYIETILDNWGDHLLYVYRIEPRMQGQYANEPTYIDRSFDGMIAMPNGTQAKFSAEAIKEKFGGRMFRFILKKGSERVCEGRLATEAAPRYPEMNPGASSPLPNAGNYAQPGGDPTAQVAIRAIDSAASREPEAIKLAMETLRTTADIMSRQHTNAPTPPADPLRDKLMDILLTRLLEDPWERMVKMREIFAPAAPTNSLQQTIEFIGALKTSGLISIGSGGRGGIWDIAGQVLPSVANSAVEGIREWRMGMEAQSRAILAQRGQPQPNPNPPTALPAASPDDKNNISQDAPPANAPQDTPAAVGGPPGGGGMEWIEERLVYILKDLSYTVDEQVDRVIDFLELTQPDLISALLNPPSIHPMLPQGERGILMLFQNRPILKQVPVNPRLTEFIKKFIVAAQEFMADHSAPTPKSAPQAVPSPQTPSA